MDYGPSNTERLAWLKLDGFRLDAVVLFCPECDFQYDFECSASPICLVCDATLQAIKVTPDLLQMAQAKAA